MTETRMTLITTNQLARRTSGVRGGNVRRRIVPMLPASPVGGPVGEPAQEEVLGTRMVVGDQRPVSRVGGHLRVIEPMLVREDDDPVVDRLRRRVICGGDVLEDPGS